MYLDLIIVFALLKTWPRLQRWATAGGLFVMCLALALSSFATKTTDLIITQGVIYAIGGSFAYSPCILYMDEWFAKRIGLAYGKLTLIHSASYTSFSDAFRHHVGWHRTCRRGSSPCYGMVVAYLRFPDNPTYMGNLPVRLDRTAPLLPQAAHTSGGEEQT